MSAMPAAETNPAKPEECWCCGNTCGESLLLHLGSHPEVTVCLLAGTTWLVGRRSGETSSVLFAGARDVMRAGRASSWITAGGELPVVGRVLLRWLDRYLP